jgi:hypothetical protein
LWSGGRIEENRAAIAKLAGPATPGGPEMTDDTELCKLIDDVNEIEKVAAEMKLARTENREPSAEVRA